MTREPPMPLLSPGAGDRAAAELAAAIVRVRRVADPAEAVRLFAACRLEVWKAEDARRRGEVAE